MALHMLYVGWTSGARWQTLHVAPGDTVAWLVSRWRRLFSLMKHVKVFDKRMYSIQRCRAATVLNFFELGCLL